jgi:hypothetical protein
MGQSFDFRVSPLYASHRRNGKDELACHGASTDVLRCNERLVGIWQEVL